MFLKFGALRHRNTELGVQKFTMISDIMGVSISADLEKK